MNWKSTLGNLFTVLVILVLIAGCLLMLPAWPLKKVTVRPYVDDRAGLLSTEAEEAIKALSFPPDVLLMVKTVEKIPLRKVSSFAYEEMERQAYWQQVRPRSWYRRQLKRDAPWSTAVFILVSKDPALIQVRYGERIRLEAYRSGLALGPEYRQHQLAFRSKQDGQEIVNTVQWLAEALPQALALPWYLRWSKPVLAVTFSEFEEFLSPGSGFYPNFILEQIISRLNRFGLASSAWLFISSLFLPYFILWMALKFGGLILSAAGDSWIESVGSIGLGLISWGLSFTLLSSGFMSLLLLGNGREEDRLLLDSLGLQSLHTIGFNTGFYFRESGFVLALLVGILIFVKDNFTDHLLENLFKDHDRPSNPNVNINMAFAVFMLLVLFLPRAISIFLLLLNVLEVFGVFAIILLLLAIAHFMPDDRDRRKPAY